MSKNKTIKILEHFSRGEKLSRYDTEIIKEKHSCSPDYTLCSSNLAFTTFTTIPLHSLREERLAIKCDSNSQSTSTDELLLLNTLAMGW